MKAQNSHEVTVLFLGDLAAFYLSLVVAVIFRAGRWPGLEPFLALALPFSYLFLAWFIVFFVSDLYGKQTTMARRRLPSVVFNAQLVNSVLAVLFFYLIPYFGVTPKTILFVCLILSFLFIVWWRRFLFFKIYRGHRENVLFLCHGKEVAELMDEFRSNQKYNIKVLNSDDPKAKDKATLIVFNEYDQPRENDLLYYRLIFSGTRFASLSELYEEVFDRVAIGVIEERWFLENISNRPKPYYDFIKRSFDLAVAVILGLISLVVYPLVWLAIKLDDRGSVFFAQTRVGRGGQIFKIWKFRTMKDNQVTRVGKWLRQSRLDELPQLWSVICGEQSLVGPRPEQPDYVSQYSREIKFYDVRHLIAPGLSGWAQIYQENHPHFQVGVEATIEKLSYDLYYLKNRSLWLDLKISLKTLNILARRKGI